MKNITDELIVKLVESTPKIIDMLFWIIPSSLLLILLKFDRITIDVIGLATFFVAGAALIQMWYTRGILDQQKKEEEIKFRAYLGFSKSEFIKTDNTYIMSYVIKNSGITPADIRSINIHVLKKDDMSNASIRDENQSIHIAPGQIITQRNTVTIDIPEDDFFRIYYLEISLNFKDYTGVYHELYLLNSIKKVGNNYDLLIEKQFET